MKNNLVTSGTAGSNNELVLRGKKEEGLGFAFGKILGPRPLERGKRP